MTSSLFVNVPRDLPLSCVWSRGAIYMQARFAHTCNLGRCWYKVNNPTVITRTCPAATGRSPTSDAKTCCDERLVLRNGQSRRSGRIGRRGSPCHKPLHPEYKTCSFMAGFARSYGGRDYLQVVGTSTPTGVPRS